MVNLVIVSHSARLGEGVGELARQMLINDGCKLAIAAGIDDPDSPIGTDPLKVMEAIESVADTDHVLVMMDIGSALLSAETALDLIDPAIAAKVRLCAAPLVEAGLINYLWPLLITTKDSMQTIVIGIRKMITTSDALTEWQLAMATAMLAMLPPVFVVIAMQRLFVKGLVETEK